MPRGVNFVKRVGTPNRWTAFPNGAEVIRLLIDHYFPDSIEKSIHEFISNTNLKLLLMNSKQRAVHCCMNYCTLPALLLLIHT